MTTDIVERLRDKIKRRVITGDPILDEAADEIERLRVELDKAHRLLSQCVSWQRDAEFAKAKKDQEIERLRTTLKVMYHAWQTDNRPPHSVIQRCEGIFGK